MTTFFFFRSRGSGLWQTIPPVSGSGGGTEGSPSAQDDEEEPSLSATLSDGGAQHQEFVPLPVNPGKPLSLEEINRHRSFPALQTLSSG